MMTENQWETPTNGVERAFLNYMMGGMTEWEAYDAISFLNWVRIQNNVSNTVICREIIDDLTHDIIASCDREILDSMRSVVMPKKKKKNPICRRCR